MTQEARPDPPYVSARAFRAFSKHVDQELGRITERLAILDALHVLAAAAPHLIELAKVLDGPRLSRLVDLAEAKADDEAFRRGLRRRLSPLRPFGALLWALVLALASGGGRGLVYLITGH